MAVLALGFVMNESGQTTTLGLWMAGAGGAVRPAVADPRLARRRRHRLRHLVELAVRSPAGHRRARRLDLSPTLLAAANSSGGVLGKMISPQNLAIAAAAVGLQGREGDIFRRVIAWSVVFLALHVRARLPAVDARARLDGALTRPVRAPATAEGQPPAPGTVSS